MTAETLPASIAASLPPALTPTPPGFVPMTDAERDTYQSRRSIALRREQAADWFAGVCPSAYHPDRTDWSHKGIAPYLTQIARVRGWQPPPPNSSAPPGLILSGDTFRGKSRAMFALMHRLRVDELRPCAFFTAAGFFARLGEQVKFGRDDAREWIDGVARHPFFFLDDLGQEAVLTSRQDHARQWFFNFLDIRRGERLPLFVSTNLTAAQISNTPGDMRSDPLLSRLLELCDPVKF